MHTFSKFIFIIAVGLYGCVPGFENSTLPGGFCQRTDFDEQEKTFLFDPQMRIYINAPGEKSFDPGKPVALVIYALPNGNMIEQTSYSKSIGAELPGFQKLKIPPRDVGGLTGNYFMNKIEKLSFSEREKLIYNEITAGNIPEFLRNLTTIRYSIEDSAGIKHSIDFQVMPDYLAIGSDDDYCRIPMGPQTAQRIADLFGASLPTAKLVDEIYQNAQAQLAPHPYFPVGSRNETLRQFVRHNAAIDSAREAMGGYSGQLIAGIKKDVILSTKISDPNRTHHVVIYGWHKPDGKPIQPVSNIHIETYVDYSHGIRLINHEIHVDGIPMHINDILDDPNLFRLISNEDEPIKKLYNSSPVQ
jgi:hypothetical protein